MAKPTKRVVYPPGCSPTEVAREAQCSRPLASRLLARGFAKEQIVERVRSRKAREAARAVSDNSSPPANGFPVTPWPTFSQSEARKEHYLAELRNVQLMKERGALIPVSYVRLWGTRFLVEARDVLLRGPNELADTLAVESDPLKCEVIVRKWVERIMARFDQCERLWDGPEDNAV